MQQIFQRRLNRRFFHSVVTANELEFPVVRHASEGFEVPVDYLRFRMQLKGDFLTLTHLPKNAYNVKGLPEKEPLCVVVLMMYFHAAFLVLVIAHTLRFNERMSLCRLTAILEYFANVLGERPKDDPF